MIVYCQGTYGERVWQTLEAVKRLTPHVDRTVIIVDETVSEEQIKSLQDLGCETYFHPWEDDFPKMRNHYLDKLQDGDWCIVSDPDEWFSPELCKDIRDVLASAEAQGITVVGVNSIDIWHKPDWEVESEVRSTFYKDLMFVYSKGDHYKGVGEAKNVHETLVLKKWNKKNLVNEDYYFEHHKMVSEVWERAMRNVYIGGGGNNVGRRNKQWAVLKGICKSLGITKWNELRTYMKKGNIDQSLKEWLVKNRYDGFDYEHEMMEGFRWYFEFLHPEENTGGWKIEDTENKKAKVMKYVEQTYMKILGRHADQAGKEHYTNAIISKKMDMHDLEHLLKSSDEYKSKMLRGLSKPGIANKWAAMMSITREIETGGAGDDDSDPYNFEALIETIVDACPPEDYKIVLNLGAGAGAETSVLAKHGYEVIGVTFGRDNIKKAWEKYGMKLVEMDMQDLRLYDNSIDLIVSIQTFEHAFSPWLAILESRRVLRDGGRIVIDVPDPKQHDILDVIWHTNVLYPDQIEALFKKAGFDLIERPNEYTFVFEKLPDDEFEMWGYVKHIMGK